MSESKTPLKVSEDYRYSLVYIALCNIAKRQQATILRIIDCMHDKDVQFRLRVALESIKEYRENLAVFAKGAVKTHPTLDVFDTKVLADMGRYLRLSYTVNQRVNTETADAVHRMSLEFTNLYSCYAKKGGIPVNLMD